jgi:hypothetical protein
MWRRTYRGEECIHEASVSEFEEEHSEDHSLADGQVRAAASLEPSPESDEENSSGDHERVSNELWRDVSSCMCRPIKGFYQEWPASESVNNTGSYQC